ncbi:Hsp70 family protein [Pseudarthrobacter sp. NamB4]|uniref:Hsp70 family protein n=1 Tax=Pseudarthrobacter sp. NamB4 TaxID=2576837 RepID=UPI0010FF5C69|nr:Hsp70 family protein [Pseudarthrobacter sp. NamB4]TLM72851.1 Hsp70 family protein [Pseudarthrobacter sp. NamB4]
MSYVLAIDVGTSFTAAAVARHGASLSPECLPLGLRGTSVPSVLFYPEDGPLLVGEAAERRGLDSPARVVREFKRRVGDAVPISAGTLSLPSEDVFATMARWVADRAEEREGAPPSEIILTHPAAWGIHRTSLVQSALAAKGLENVTLLTEPEAAALHYASQVRVEDGSIIAVYDLGGGTFDTAVLRKVAGNRFELLGPPEGFEYMGGADFDAALFRYVAEHTGGALAGLEPAEPGVLAALARLRRECVEAKEALSVDSEANISVLLPGIQQQVRLVRPEFESLIEESVRDTVDALEQSLKQLELEPADLTAVLLIGGSSRIPLVAQLISEQLERPIAVDADPKSSICLGAAVSAVLGQKTAADATTAAGGNTAENGAAAVVPHPSDESAGHLPPLLPSWSRNGTAATRSVAPAARGPSRGGRNGAHAPKPRVRLTAVTATAVLLTALTATAAQSPEGFNSLTSVFVPPAGASNDLGALPPTGAGGGTGSDAAAAAAAAGEVEFPATAVEPGVERAASAQGTGSQAAPDPTSRVSSIRAIEGSASDEPSAAAAAAGPATSSSPAAEPVPGTEGTTGTLAPTPTDTSPTPTDTTPAGETSSNSASPTATDTPSGTPSRAHGTQTPTSTETGTATAPPESGEPSSSMAGRSDSPTSSSLGADNSVTPLESSNSATVTAPATTTSPAA